MGNRDKTSIQIDLEQFKLHLKLPGESPLSFHFDTPSRRFYLSLIALVAENMRENGGMAFVPLEAHADTLALLNETVGEEAGSSEIRNLLPRIYNKWKGALPDLEKAPLFKVVGRKKGYEDSSGKVYRFDEKTKDAWANLFEYRGSREKVRLRFSVQKLGIEPKDVAIDFGKQSNADKRSPWDRFIGSLRIALEAGAPKIERGNKPEGCVSYYGIDKIRKENGVVSQASNLKRDQIILEDSQKFAEFDDLKVWLEQEGSIEKIPMEARLGLIARLAMAPRAYQEKAAPYEAAGSEKGPLDDMDAGDLPGSSPSQLTDGRKNGPQEFGMGIQGMFGANISYRAPELQEGCLPSSRSDVYALGVLLYQMVVGDLSRSLGADWGQAVKDTFLQEAIAAAVEKNPEKRLANPALLAERLLALYNGLAVPPMEISTGYQDCHSRLRRQQMKKRFVFGSLFVIILVLLIGLGLHEYKVVQVEAARKSAYETDLPAIKKLLDEEKYVEAHALTIKTEQIIPHDPTLTQYIKKATNTLDINTTPSGARISYRPYGDVNGPWVDVGLTPIPDARIPVGMNRWRVQKEGYEERELVRAVMPRDAYCPELESFLRSFLEKLYHFCLYEKGSVPQGMLAVDRGQFIVPIAGLPANKTTMLLDYFFIDKTEVTNRAYKEFVDEGGYADPAWWKETFIKEGKVIPWLEAVKGFVDRTGRSGPSTWELSDYPEGQDTYPVSGVSWYEAAAYAEFRGKNLPTIYHWARAVFPIREISTPLTPHIVRLSNIEGKGLAQVGSYPDIGSSGAKDMAGNVREWCWNAVGNNRYCQGGMWQDATYIFNQSVTPSTWDRSPGNGFRCVVYPGDAPVSKDLLKDIALGVYDPYDIPPYSKEAFKALKAMFAYEPTPLHPVVEAREEGGRGWRRETVTIDAAYNQERLIVHLDLPTAYPPPYKAVIYFPGGSALYQPQFSRNSLWEPWDAIPKAGRALISPIYSGTFERGQGQFGKGEKKSPVQWFSERLNDLRRTIDYLETRKDLDAKNLAFLGVCWGGAIGPVLAAYEERIRGLILFQDASDCRLPHQNLKAWFSRWSRFRRLCLMGNTTMFFRLKRTRNPFSSFLAPLLNIRNTSSMKPVISPFPVSRC